MDSAAFRNTCISAVITAIALFTCSVTTIYAQHSETQIDIAQLLADGTAVTNYPNWSYDETTYSIYASDDVTVVGTVANGPQLTFYLYNGATVKWQADYSGTFDDPDNLINVWGNDVTDDGIFEVVAGGSIANTGTGIALFTGNFIYDVTVSGGSVSNTNGMAIFSWVPDVVITVSGNGKVSADNGTAINCTGSAPLVRVTDNAEVKTTSDFNTTINCGGDVEVSGGKVIAEGFESRAISTFGTTPSLVKVSDGIVEATGDNSYAIYACANVEVSGGSVLSDGGGNGAILSEGGDIEVSGGLVQASGGSNTAISVSSAGSVVTVSGGIVQTMDANSTVIAVGNGNTNAGTVIISGNGIVQANGGASDGIYASGYLSTVTVDDNGKISCATAGSAIYTDKDNSTVTINNGTIETADWGVTIVINGTGSNLTVKGGHVSAGLYTPVIRSDSPNSIVTILGGNIIAEDVYAIVINDPTSSVSVTGGLVVSPGTSMADVIDAYTPFTGPTGEGIVVAWDKNTWQFDGSPDFLPFATDYLSITPSSATPVTWRRVGTESGIMYSYGSNKGFCPVVGVNVIPDTDYGLIFDASDGAMYLDLDNDGLVNADYEYTINSGITWEGHAGQLILTDFEWETSAPVALLIVNGDAVIELHGTNSLVSTFNGSELTSGVLASDPNSFTFTGNGTLIATGGDGDGTNPSYGIRSEASITIDGGLIIATSGANNAGFGISMYGNFTVNGGAFEAAGSNSALTTAPDPLPAVYAWWVSEAFPFTPTSPGTPYYGNVSGSIPYVFSSSDKYVKIESTQVALVNNVTINGVESIPLPAGSGIYTALITLYGDEVVSGGVSGNVDGWFATGLPGGVTVTASAAGGSRLITLSFSGTPTTTSTAAFDIVIPSAIFVNGQDVPVQPNAAARFNIIAVSYGISLSVTGTHTFPSATHGYGAQAPLSVTVSNTGVVATGPLAVSITGANASAFTANSNSIPDIAVNGSATFSITPLTGLAAGTYTAIVTVGNSNVATRSFTISFTVSPAVVPQPPRITGTLWMTLDEGYKAISTGAYNITGTAPVTVTKTSGTDRITWNNSTRTLDIAEGLPVGIYKVTLVASNSSGYTYSFVFTLTVSVPVYYIDNPVRFTGGTVEAIPQYLAEADQPVRLFVTPNQGFELVSIHVYRSDNGQSVPLNGTVSLLNFTMPTSHVNVMAVFREARDTHAERVDNDPPIQAWIFNNMLHVSGLKAGSDWSVYSITGMLVSKGKTLNGNIEIRLPGKGIYIITDGTQTIKVSGL